MHAYWGLSVQWLGNPFSALGLHHSQPNATRRKRGRGKRETENIKARASKIQGERKRDSERVWEPDRERARKRERERINRRAAPLFSAFLIWHCHNSSPPIPPSPFTSLRLLSSILLSPESCHHYALLPNSIPPCLPRVPGFLSYSSSCQTSIPNSNPIQNRALQ